MHIMAPKNKWELSDMMKFAVSSNVPIAVRYPRGEAYDGLKEMRAPLQMGKSEVIFRSDSAKIALFALGSMVKTAIKVKEILNKKNIEVTVINARFAKPVDTDMIDELARDYECIVTMEENVANGGLGDKVLEHLNETNADVKVLQIAIPDEYVEHGNVSLLHKEVGIDADSIVEKIEKI